MKLFNSLSNKKEKLQHNPAGKFTVYFCGPTVYNFAHIGNFRTYLLQDVLVRTLDVDGHNPFVVRNITDVDDKTIRDSIKNNVSLKEFTEKWAKIFHEDCYALNILKPDIEPKATEHIAEQIDMIKTLISKGFAYVASDGSVYFRVAAFKKYGALSNIEKRELKTQELDSAGKKNLADEYDRENVTDFALWKASKPEDGENFWESPWGNGRPGWHIECSAMSRKYLGDTIDLHSGGVDLKFPHHENEIAQSECTTGKQFAKHWMHIAHLLVDGTKMSKSLGNLYTLNDIIHHGYSAQCLRYALISAHYSQQLNFTFNNLVAAKNALEKLQKFLHNLDRNFEIKKFDIKNWKFFSGAIEALLDDLNTPACLGNVFKAINETSLDSLKEADKTELLREFSTIMYCLGLSLDDREEALEIPGNIKNLAQKRWDAKQSKNFAESDHIRQEIASLGWNIKDSKDGYSIEKI